MSDCDYEFRFRVEAPKTPLFLFCSQSLLKKTIELVSEIDNEIPVYVLSADSLEFEPVEEVAAKYRERIREIQPTGPYRLVGWGCGGILAYEIAIQLIGYDELTEFVGLIETYAPQYIDHRKSNQSVAKKTSKAPSENGTQTNAIYTVKSSHTRSNYSPLEARGLISLFLLPNLSQQGPEDTDESLGWKDVLPEEKLRICRLPSTSSRENTLIDLRILGRELTNGIENGWRHLSRPPDFDYSPLVAIKINKNPVEQFFCIPGAGDNVIKFADFAAAVPRTAQVYGLQPRGLEGRLIPHLDVSSCANVYAKAIAAAAKSTSIHLIGHSFGGWVALETALNLEDAGFTIASLTILDSDIPEDSEDNKKRTHLDFFMDLVSVIELSVGGLGILRTHVEAMNEQEKLAHLHALLVARNVLNSRSDPGVLFGPWRAFLAACQCIFKPPRPYRGAAQIFIVPESDISSGANKDRYQRLKTGWSKWAPDAKISVGPGNHVTMLQKPHLTEWLKELSAMSKN